MMLALAPWLTALLIASLKGSVILIAALLIARMMRRSSAEARHAVLAIGLCAFLLVPIATALAPRWTQIELPPVPPSIVDNASWVRGGALPAPSGDVASQGLGAQPDASPNPGLPDADRPPADDVKSFELPSPATLLISAWLAGASLIILRLLLGIVRLRILSRRATMVTDGAWLHAAHAIARRLGLTRGVTLLRGDREAVPMTWGVLSPVVWLPPAADTWPAELRSSVLSHELAHVRRRDAVTQWLANVAVAVHWFNPLVWIAARALRAERERACDDAVLALGAAPDDYAAHLLDMVRALGAKSGPAPAMAMARQSHFEGRLLAILDRACSRAPVGTARLAGAAAGALALVLILGGLRTGEAARVAVSESATPAPAERPSANVEPSKPGAEPPAVPPVRDSSGPAMNAGRQRTSLSSPLSIRASSPAVAIGNATPAPVVLPRVNAPALRSDSGVDAQSLQAPSPLPALSRADTTLLLEVISAAEGISSSMDRTTVLDRVANLPDLSPNVVTALARAARRVPSSSERSKLLKSMIRTQKHAFGESRRAVLDAVTGEMTSTDAAGVLEHFVRRDNLSDEALEDAFNSVGKLTSSSDKARVLVSALRVRKPQGVARAAYVKAASTITNGSDRARVLSALLEDAPPKPQGHEG